MANTITVSEFTSNSVSTTIAKKYLDSQNPDMNSLQQSERVNGLAIASFSNDRGERFSSRRSSSRHQPYPLTSHREPLQEVDKRCFRVEKKKPKYTYNEWMTCMSGDLDAVQEMLEIRGIDPNKIYSKCHKNVLHSLASAYVLSNPPKNVVFDNKKVWLSSLLEVITQLILFGANPQLPIHFKRENSLSLMEWIKIKPSSEKRLPRIHVVEKVVMDALEAARKNFLNE